MLGFAPIEKFVDYIGACDIVLNLRYPTVGETSGSLQRALGLGSAVIVSDVGSFAELPDDVCLKVPVSPDRKYEEENSFLNTSACSRRGRIWRRRWGRARRSGWSASAAGASVAERYVEFLRRVCEGTAGAEEPDAGQKPGGTRGYPWKAWPR